MLYDIELQRGCMYECTLYLKDTSGNATDLTGFAFQGQIRNIKTNELLSNIPIIISDALSGEIQLSFTPDQTRSFPETRNFEYQYNILYSESDQPLELIGGRVLIKGEVTQWVI
jgi:hypothetical protein